MSRQDANAAFARTSFLYGGNAGYIDELYARYEADPQAVDGQWRAFFESLKDDARDVAQNAEGPSWGRPDWPLLPRGDLVAALDGDWDEVGKELEYCILSYSGYANRGVDSHPVNKGFHYLDSAFFTQLVHISYLTLTEPIIAYR